MKKYKKSKKAQRKTAKNRLLLIMFVILIIVAIISIYNNLKEKEVLSEELNIKSEIFKDVGTSTAKVSKYIVYGTHLNLEGTLNISNPSIDSARLIIRTKEIEDITINTEYSIENNILQFTTGENINEGINLESFDVSSYYLLLRVMYTNGQEQYYSLSNDTEYGNIEYYTITKNNENNRIYINFNEYNSISYLNLKVSKVEELPDDVYDIVIDPGHGGLDVGTVNGTYYESEIVLDCAKQLKTKLEDLGLKVFLTRDGIDEENENTAYNMYDDDGRITIAMESHAKIFISLHMNSNEAYLNTGGVEVYVPDNFNLTFAELLADNIVTMANTNYSNMNTYKLADGVYMHNFSESDIIAAREEALNAGYEPYENITTSTSYLFIYA